MRSIKQNYSRVILERDGKFERLCSLHLCVSTGEVLFDFKDSLSIVSSSKRNICGNLSEEFTVGLKSIQHIHFISKQNKIVLTQRNKQENTFHSNPFYRSPGMDGNKKLYKLPIFILGQESFPVYFKEVSSMDFVLKIPEHDDRYSYTVGFWHGEGFNKEERRQMENSLFSLYEEKHQNPQYIQSKANRIYSVYIVVFKKEQKESLFTTMRIQASNMPSN